MLGRSLGLLGAVAGMLLLGVTACDDETETEGTGGATSTGTGGAGGTGGSVGGTGGSGGEAGSGGSAPVCGNGVVETGEECEPPNTAVCDASCMSIPLTPCDEADSYDTDCEGVTQGQWCWDGGSGGALFCGCDPAWGNVDCQVAGYEYCNPALNLCEPPPDCGDDTNEPNDDEASATPIDYDTPLDGATCGFDPDWFTFQATAENAVITATWTDDGESILDLRVTDCADNTVASAATDNPDSETVAATGLTVGTAYCVLVSHYMGAAGGADVVYSLVVEVPADCGDDANEPNDDEASATSVTIGTPVNGATCTFDPDWFTFQAGDVTAAITASWTDDGETDLDLRVTDCAGTQLASSLSGDPATESLVANGLTAGTDYCVLVEHYSGAAGGTDAAYSLVVQVPQCGNGIVEPGEICDGTDLNGEDCTTQGFNGGGTLACNANCLLWNVSQCTMLPPVCGNNVTEGFEFCDGTDMGGATGVSCADIGFTGGTITCTGCEYDFTTCTGGPAGWTCRADYYNDGYCDCGCGVADAAADCADATLAACEYCNNLGSCNGYADCGDPNSVINPTNNAVCTAVSCGDGSAEAWELCDGADLRGLTCADVGMGFAGGTLVCNASCEHDMSGCTMPTCGDNVAEGFEPCDGTDLAGNTCASLNVGFFSGTLACSGCNFDTSGCVMGGWNCSPSYFDAQDGCDCGCGLVDPDCADATVASCDYCNDAGSCSTTACPGTINPTDNSTCN